MTAMHANTRFYYMCFMPYIHLPQDEADYKSMWVDLPNRLYDPQRGHALYQRYLDEYVEADKLGFDGIVVNEHHSTAYSMMPATNLIASALIQRTQRARVVVMGSLLNLQYPNRLAEEYAMLDVMSGGRLECAFPFGTGMEYWSNAAQINPATACERFREGLEVLHRAWTEDGPFRHDGRFYNYKALNLWPRPYQQPHPRIWLVGGGSSETIELAARNNFGYSCVLIPAEQQDRAYAAYRERSAAYGHEVTGDDMILAIFCYVAETDEIAEREGKEHLMWYFNTALRTQLRYLVPPGYVTESTLRRQLASADALYSQDHRTLAWEDVQQWRAVMGSPQTVADRLREWLDTTGAGRVIAVLHAGDMPHWKTIKNMTLFAEEVMPRVRGER